MFISCLLSGTANTRETIAIIGAGDMGDSLDVRLAKLGYTIVYSSRKSDRGKVTALHALNGLGASATTQKGAARSGEIVILAAPWPAMESVA